MYSLIKNRISDDLFNRSKDLQEQINQYYRRMSPFQDNTLSPMNIHSFCFMAVTSAKIARMISPIFT